MLLCVGGHSVTFVQERQIEYCRWKAFVFIEGAFEFTSRAFEVTVSIPLEIANTEIVVDLGRGIGVFRSGKEFLDGFRVISFNEVKTA